MSRPLRQTDSPTQAEGGRPALQVVFCGADRYWEEVSGNEIRRRNLFFLRAFAADPRVEHVFVLHRRSRREILRRRLGSLWRRLVRRAAPSPSFGASALAVARWLPERSWLPWFRHVNRLLARRSVQRRLGVADARRVVWCYGLGGLSLAQYLDLEGTWFVDTDHDLVNDPSRPPDHRRKAEERMLRGAERSRRVFSASRNMLGWLADRGFEERARRLRNGVVPGRFEAARAGRTPGASGEAPVFSYVGILSPGIDFALLVELARRRPGWRFSVVGAWYRMQPPAELEAMANVELLGFVDSPLLPRWLASCDVGLALYRREPWLDLDSMKLYEYLAAELPVISTPFHDHLEEDFEGLLSLADSAAGFEERAQEILGWSEAERRDWSARARDFVRRSSWTVRADEALDTIRRELEGT